MIIRIRMMIENEIRLIEVMKTCAKRDHNGIFLVQYRADFSQYEIFSCQYLLKTQTTE